MSGQRRERVYQVSNDQPNSKSGVVRARILRRGNDKIMLHDQGDGFESQPGSNEVDMTDDKALDAFSIKWPRVSKGQSTTPDPEQHSTIPWR